MEIFTDTFRFSYKYLCHPDLMFVLFILILFMITCFFNQNNLLSFRKLIIIIILSLSLYSVFLMKHINMYDVELWVLYLLLNELFILKYLLAY